MNARRLTWILSFTSILLASGASGGNLYASGDIGFGFLNGDVGGTTEGVVTFDNTGSDNDASPIFGGTIGFEFPLDEALPWDIPLPGWMGESFRMPSWTVRTELEGRYRLDSEFLTDGFSPATPFRTEVSSWSVMHNLWMDFPVSPPISALFGRVPLLEPMKIYTGVGLGLAGNTADTSDTVVRGSDTSYSFAYQFGGGLSYALTEWATISLGYRYVDLGQVDVSLEDAGSSAGNLTVDLTGHEIGTALRFNFYSIPLRGNR